MRVLGINITRVCAQLKGHVRLLDKGGGGGYDKQHSDITSESPAMWCQLRHRVLCNTTDSMWRDFVCVCVCVCVCVLVVCVGGAHASNAVTTGSHQLRLTTCTNSKRLCSIWCN
jgi:hypothetical protein